eukprot:2025930-Pyramimonas_sp.AAC.1
MGRGRHANAATGAFGGAPYGTQAEEGSVARRANGHSKTDPSPWPRSSARSDPHPNAHQRITAGR